MSNAACKLFSSIFFHLLSEFLRFLDTTSFLGLYFTFFPLQLYNIYWKNTCVIPALATFNNGLFSNSRITARVSWFLITRQTLMFSVHHVTHITTFCHPQWIMFFYCTFFLYFQPLHIYIRRLAKFYKPRGMSSVTINLYHTTWQKEGYRQL